MKRANHLERSRRQGRRGYVLVSMATMAITLIGAMGLAVDMGRVFIAKNETQIYADAAALGAAIELDGTDAGITRAVDRVNQSGNSWNLHSTTVTGATVEFAPSQAGPWETSPANPVGYAYARVSLTVADPLYFIPMIVSSYHQNVVSSAIAGQIPINTFPVGLSPFTAVSFDPHEPDYGFVKGNEYTIQWPQMTPNSGACREDNPNGCFVRDPCANDSDYAKYWVSQRWSNSQNGYWGSNSNNEIRQYVLDLKQIMPISIGDNLDDGGTADDGLNVLANGNKAVEKDVLDERVGEDEYQDTNDPDVYLANSLHNGRRLLTVPIVRPDDEDHTIVVGFGQFLLYSNGGSDPDYYRDVYQAGNEPFCAVYVGPFTLGSNDNSGRGNGTGGTRVRLLN